MHWLPDSLNNQILYKMFFAGILNIVIRTQIMCDKTNFVYIPKILFFITCSLSVNLSDSIKAILSMIIYLIWCMSDISFKNKSSLCSG